MSRVLKILSLLAVLTMVLAACGQAETPSTGTQPTAAPSGGTEATAAPATGGEAGGKLEMFSWWTTGGEEAGLKAMYGILEKQKPGVEIINQAVAGAAGADAKAVLKTRMQGGDPPDAFQVHMGQELIAGYVKAGQV